MSFRDGVGERRPASGQGQQELLGIRAELCTVPAFEFALRERLNRLSRFRHGYYAQALSVERLPDPEAPLGLVSDRALGIRLSELFTSAAARGLNLDINAALCLIRQLVPAVAKLHEAGGDIAHAALGPERVIVTPNARLVITEYVLGPALELLHYSQDRYWKDLRIALPRSAGLPRFDQRADVTQVGVIALSLILGRLLRDDEYPSKVSDVVASARAVSPKGGFEPLPTGIRGWLGRALQLDARHPFANAIEANAELEQVLSDSEYLGSPASLESFLARYAAAEAIEQFSAEAAASVPEPESKAASVSVLEVEPSADLMEFVSETVTPEGPLTAQVDPVVARPEAGQGRSGRQVPADPFPGLFGQPESPSRARMTWLFAGAAAATILVAVGVPLMRGGEGAPRAGSASAPTGTLLISTNPPGAVTLIDGRPGGTTPLTLTLAAGPHTVELRGDGGTRMVPVTVNAGAQSVQYIELPSPETAVGEREPPWASTGASDSVDEDARGVPRRAGTELASGDRIVVPGPGATVAEALPVVGTSGWLTVSAPIDLQIREGDQLLGSSQGDRVVLSPGRHDLELVNEAFGFHTSRPVQVIAGKAVSVNVDLPDGTVAVNALPWADVWLDGARLGETPIGNVPVRIGEHDVVLRHPELGEQRHRLTVTATGVSRLSADLRKP